MQRHALNLVKNKLFVSAVLGEIFGGNYKKSTNSFGMELHEN
jgi:hypothetical protein